MLCCGVCGVVECVVLWDVCSVVECVVLWDVCGR